MYVGIDIGGSNTRIASTTSLDDVSITHNMTFTTSNNFEQGIINLCENITTISVPPDAIGIGIAGRVSENKQLFTHSNNLKDWVDKPIIRILQDRFNCPIFIENDVVAQSYAQVYYGKEKYTSFIYLAWGTGLGACLVIKDNNIVTYEKLGREHLGHWEEKIGGKNIEQKFGKLAGDLNEGEWEIVLKEFKECLVSLGHTFNVSYIVISGGVANKLKEKILDICRDIHQINISFSELGDNIGIYGGFSIIRKNTKI